LGEPIAKEVPVAMMALVTNLIANEVADEANLDKAFWVSIGL